MQNLHIIATNYVQSKHDLFNAGCARKHPFMGFVQNYVNRLIEPFEGALQQRTTKTVCISRLFAILTTNCLPSAVIIETVSVFFLIKETHNLKQQTTENYVLCDRKRIRLTKVSKPAIVWSSSIDYK